MTNSDLERMKTMKRLLTIALTAGLTLLGSTALAVEHIVRIEGPGYFPNVVYFQVGDTVKFENYGPFPARLKYTSGNWYTSSNIGKNSSVTMPLNSSSTINLYGPYYAVSTYFGGTSYAQYSYTYQLKLVRDTAPNSCPDSRVIC